MEDSREGGGQVFLQVYDLVNNDWVHWAGCGIYHSGVEIYGVEWAYGGHELDAPGIFATRPKEAPGDTITWREAIPCGRTSLNPAQVHELVQEMGREFKGNKYHLLQMNCNTFSSELVYRLTGERPPLWVNRMASLAVNLHCLLPQGWVPPLRPPSMVPEEGRETLLDGNNNNSNTSLSEDRQGLLYSPPTALAGRPGVGGGGGLEGGIQRRGGL